MDAALGTLKRVAADAFVPAGGTNGFYSNRNMPSCYKYNQMLQ
jgi:hypothetical protein